MIKDMKQCEKDSAMQVADIMLSSAKTAPKGSGKDKIVGMILSGAEMMSLADEMDKAGHEYKMPFFNRDADNVRNSHCIVLLACVSEPMGLDNCGMCGFKNCGNCMKNDANCVFNISDLGIAVGSAVSVAALNNMDNRVMYSAGRGAIRLGLFSPDVRVCYGIPLFTGSKSIFFDRNPGAVLL